MPRSGIILAAALAVLAGPITGASAAAQETGQTITLERALEMALINNPQLAQSNASLINAGTTRQRAWGSFLPNVSMSSGSSLSSSQRFDQNTQRIVTGSSTSYSAGLSASYQLFQGGRKFHEMDRTASAYREAEARLHTQRFSVMLQTRTLFLNALRQADLMRVQEASLERTAENHSISLARFAADDATLSDTLRTLLDLSNARQSLLQAQNQLRTAQWSLGRQVGIGGPVVPIVPEAGLDPAPLRLSEAEIMALAESASPAVRAAEEATRVAQIAVNNARSSYLPNLSMSSRYNWANQDRSFSGGSTSWGFSLSGSYTLFDGFGREASVSQANQSRRVSRLSEEDARRSVRQEVDAALRTLETQEQAIEIARASVLVAEADLRIVRLRYQAEQNPILDVIVSQLALEQAEVNLVAARYDYAIAKAELESIIGVEL
ncbi:MAG: TolC family protein [Gemmatimonadota bacterium]|nr:TolC family protein [Gemmatimonadota bacterium]